MSKSVLIDTVAETSGLTKKASGEVVEAILDLVTKSLKGDGAFSIAGFGAFTVRKRAARKGRNPATGEEIKIKASKSVAFRPAKALKESI